MTGYQTILLDADGTLFDFDRAEAVALERALSLFGLPFDGEILSLYHQINEALWKALERKELERSVLLRERFARLLARIGGNADAEKLNDAYLDGLADCSFLIPGAEELCRELHPERQLYIATNGVERVQKKRLAVSPIAPFIDGIFVSEALGAQKPDPAFFDGIFRAIGEDRRKNAIMIGDSLTSDMLGGRNAGIPVCWVAPDPGAEDGGLKPDFIVRSLAELLPVIRGESLEPPSLETIARP